MDLQPLVLWTWALKNTCSHGSNLIQGSRNPWLSSLAVWLKWERLSLVPARCDTEVAVCPRLGPVWMCGCVMWWVHTSMVGTQQGPFSGSFPGVQGLSVEKSNWFLPFCIIVLPYTGHLVWLIFSSTAMECQKLYLYRWKLIANFQMH